MGKTKKTRTRLAPANSNVIKRNEDLDTSKTSIFEATINSLLDQLQVPDAEENLCGLRRLSELFFNEKCVISSPNQSVNRELQQRFIKSVSPFLVDQRSDIRNAAAGALRNVSIAGGPLFCNILVSDDVMTPLVALILKYENELVVKPNVRIEELEFVDKLNLDTLLNAVNLLWNLCESNETAVSYFNTSNIASILIRFLDVNIGGIELSIAVAQCLHTVSDDNRTVLLILKDHEEEIIKLIMMENNEPSYLHIRTLAAGLLVNTHGKVPLTYLKSTFNVLSKTIEIDSRNGLCSLSSEIPLEKETVLSSDCVTKLADLVAVIEAQTTAFEILTNICSGEEDDMEADSVNDSDDDEDLELSNSREYNDVSITYPLTVDSDIHEALVKLNLLEHSYNKTSLPVNVSDILANHTDTKEVLKKFNILRCRAFHFINNLITVLDSADLGSPDSLFKMWTDIGSIIINGESEVNIVESSTAALRSVLMKLVSSQHPQLCQIKPSDLEIIFKIVDHCKDDTVCVNITQAVGALGVYFASKNNEVLVTGIGRFLLTIAERQGPLWLVAEALDALMDVFAEDNTDKVAHEISLVPHLDAVLPAFKRKVRTERKSLGDNYALVTTANSNLSRFITYKKNRLLTHQNGKS